MRKVPWHRKLASRFEAPSWARVGHVLELPRPVFAAGIVVTLFLSWFVTRELGGAGVGTPHGLYLPVVLAAYGFGWGPTIVVSLVEGFLVGPIMPDHFSHGVAYAQPTGEWVSQTIEFLIFGQVMALLFRHLRRQRDAARAALRDPLTGLANRVLFLDRLRQALGRLERSGGVVGVLFLDLDDFKALNDRAGHRAGDELLTALAQRLQAAVRAGETLARLSGDEFAVVVEGTDYSAPMTTAQRLLDMLQVPFSFPQKQAFVHASVGVATTSDRACSADILLHRADLAMYAAKRAGKNCYEVYPEELAAVS